MAENTAEIINGKDYLSFFRRYADRSKKDAAAIRFMTEVSVKLEKETDSTSTVDGKVSSVSDGDNTLDVKSIAYRTEDPEVVEMWKQMREWFLNEEVVEVWNVDIKSGKENSDTHKTEYLVDYFQGKFTEFEMKSAADGKVELSYSYAIDGRGIWNHKDALSEEQQLAVKAAQYAYHTLAKESAI
ncbi:phage major tail protein, TP901-1 family [Streptococcus lutetiensis]|uniref:phage major tail protein, TP901-1 family n=1 Tax=Streptococcus lutetiensis TaxID=150055 RepID=UPI000FE1F6F8|nr:phage major tail protein, TP901-1 family [Streptococcus lutetiensis]RHB84881.1 phage major tail protein, TP901-1 family [Streptococcus lutetiensis]